MIEYGKIQRTHTNIHPDYKIKQCPFVGRLGTFQYLEKTSWKQQTLQ